jgi:O-antigen ligase
VQTVGTVQRSPSLPGLLSALGLAVLGALIAVGTTLVGPLAVLPIFGLLFFALVVARPEYGIALFVSTFLISYPVALRGTGSLTINNVLGGMFLILLTYKVYNERDWWFLRCRELQLLAFIYLVAAIGDRLNAPDPRLVNVMGVVLAEANTTRTFLTRSIFTLFFVNFIRKPRHMVIIYLLITVLMAVAAVSGVREVLHGGGLHGYRAVSRVIYTAANPNRLAMFAIMSIAGIWYLTRSLRVRVLFVFAVPLIAVLALAVIMTGSRSGLLGLAVCGTAILVKERLNLTQLLTLGLIGMVVLLLGLNLVPQKTRDRITNLPFTEAGQTGLGAGSLARRWGTWEMGFSMFKQHPFIGVGIGNWELTRYLNDPERSTSAPHSSYLLALVETGLLGLTAFLYLLWLTWRNIRAVLPYVTARGSPLASIEWIVHSIEVDLYVLLFFSMFADLWQLVTLFLLIGFSVAIRRLVETRALEEALQADR